MHKGSEIFILGWVCSLLLSIFTFHAFASTESRALVAEGRALLFNAGNPAYSGLLAANDKFEAAVVADPADQEANLFYAVTRAAAFGLEQGSGAGLETLRDLYEAFGIVRNGNDSLDASPIDDPPEIFDQYNPPDSIPSGEQVRAFLAGPFLNLLDAALANLAVVDSTISITLAAEEIGEDAAVEVDYGDVLAFRTALYGLKTLALLVVAYDLNVDIRDVAVKINADVFQLQRDVLDIYSSFLKLRDADGSASLVAAKQALLAGIGAYESAFNYINAETDSQHDDLLYFESDSDLREADFLLSELDEIRGALAENRPAVFTTVRETWTMTGNGGSLELWIEKDGDGNWVDGHADNFGEVEDCVVSGGVITISIDCGTDCLLTLTGTLSGDGSQIVDGAFESAEGGEVIDSGAFTGERTSVEQEDFRLDLNYVFGNSGKSQLNVRNVLPEFDERNEMLAGTFPTPVLGSVFPDVATENDLAETFDAELVCAAPTASVSGTVATPSFTGSGNVFILAYDGPNPISAHLLGNAIVEGSGGFAVAGLPIGAAAYLFAWYDADDNGILTVGDYCSAGSGPYVVVAQGLTGVYLAANQAYDQSMRMKLTFRTT